MYFFYPLTHQYICVHALYMQIKRPGFILLLFYYRHREHKRKIIVIDLFTINFPLRRSLLFYYVHNKYLYLYQSAMQQCLLLLHHHCTFLVSIDELTGWECILIQVTHRHFAFSFLTSLGSASIFMYDCFVWSWFGLWDLLNLTFWTIC